MRLDPKYFTICSVSFQCLSCGLCEQKLVVKPDQLIKRRGKLGLIKVNADLAEVKTWVGERMGKDTQVFGAVVIL